MVVQYKAPFFCKSSLSWLFVATASLGFWGTIDSNDLALRFQLHFTLWTVNDEQWSTRPYGSLQRNAVFKKGREITARFHASFAFQLFLPDSDCAIGSFPGRFFASFFCDRSFHWPERSSTQGNRGALPSLNLVASSFSYLGTRMFSLDLHGVFPPKRNSCGR